MYENMIAITNRKLCQQQDYLEQLSLIASLHPKAVVLREKDLSSESYLKLAKEAVSIFQKYETPLILHNFADAAVKLSHPYIHMPLYALQDFSLKNGSMPCSVFKKIGTSVHSVQDAKEACKLGASYLFAGNIYETECKPGLCGRGLTFLKEIVSSVDIPVYAIGGITPDRMPAVMKTGAAGGCMMSGFMNIKPL